MIKMESSLGRFPTSWVVDAETATPRLGGSNDENMSMGWSGGSDQRRDILLPPGPKFLVKRTSQVGWRFSGRRASLEAEAGQVFTVF